MEIRDLNKEDLSLRVQWMNHPAIYKSMHYTVPVLLDKTEQWFKRISDDPSRHDMVFVENGRIVAMGGLTHIDQDVSKSELYIFVDPLSQRSGVGTTAVRLLCQYGFLYLNLNKIYLITNEDNIPAQKVYMKCGFSLEGTLREEYVSSDGGLKSRFYYGLLKKECYG